MARIWRKREAQLTRMQDGLLCVVGDLQGIGEAALHHVPRAVRGVRVHDRLADRVGCRLAPDDPLQRLAMVVVGFVVTNPYAVLDYQAFRDDFLYNYIVAPMVHGANSSSP